MASDPTPPRRILLVAYYYPPLNSTGALRPAALGKWLRRRGHDVTVLTSLHVGHGPDDKASRVLRTRDLLATRVNWRRQTLDVATGRQSGLWQPHAPLWSATFVPDVQFITWMPFAVVAALRLNRRFAFDVVITTSPLESAHAPGLALSFRGVPWVVDLRDGWRFEAPRREWPLAIQRRLDDALERLVLRRADQIVTVSEPISRDIRARFGVGAETITNGFDPDEIRGVLPPSVAVTPDRLTLVHTGSLGDERSIEPLVAAMTQIADQDPGLGRRLELILAGPLTQQEHALLARPDFRCFVRHVGSLARPEALALQRAADVLVLATTGVRSGEATGKLYEYLAACRPILVLGDRTAAADIVRRARAGYVIPARDSEAAEATLRSLVVDRPLQPSASAIASYAYPALTARYEEIVERAIASRRPAI
jgi:glycosyltransferase involved in cell wall biosynthesis